MKRNDLDFAADHLDRHLGAMVIVLMAIAVVLVFALSG
jgi:hypothetical protein